MKRFMLLILLLLCLHLDPASASKHGQIKLLAVAERGNEMNGSVADLSLDIIKGEGRVFIDTIPLSKTDTQMSTRFAKEIACDFLNLDCEGYDFIYTIRSESIIIGGPSAGSAIAALTVAVLQNMQMDEKAAITGTINSGGLIGPVGGVKQKIEAAARAGIKKVMIARGTSLVENDEDEEGNETIDLKEYGKNQSVEVIEVSDLYEAMQVFNGALPMQAIRPEAEIKADEKYIEVMEELAQLLCNRSEELRNRILEYDSASPEMVNDEFLADFREAENLTAKAKTAFEKERYYTSASYCFGANTKYGRLMMVLNNITDDEFKEYIKSTSKALLFLNEKISNKTLTTITDLQAYMVVKERIVEAMDAVKKSNEKFENGEEGYVDDYAYAVERMFSAISWSEFFDKGGKQFELNKEMLKQSCIRKINEAQERISFVELIFSTPMQEANKGLKYAQEDYDKGNYELCLFKASKAKAEANTILDMTGVTDEHLDSYIDNRIDTVKRVIMKAVGKGVFPILGYSYLEYAESLREGDLYSTVLYLEYALELSDMDRYFEQKKKPAVDLSDYDSFFIFVLGVIAGLLLSTIKRKQQKGESKIKNKIKKKYKTF